MAAFNGFWMPSEILAIKELTPTEKLVYAAVLPLAINEGCNAGNKHFAEQLGISKTSVSLNLKSLDEKGYILVHNEKRAGNIRIIFVYRSALALFKNIKDPSLSSRDSLIKFLKEPPKDDEGALLTNLKRLFNNLKAIYKVEFPFEFPLEITLAQSSDGAMGDDEETDKKTLNDALSFEAFWNAYGKKTGRPKCEPKWAALPQKTKRLILDHVPGYIKKASNPKYRKDPYTYLNSQIWLDEPEQPKRPAPSRPDVSNLTYDEIMNQNFKMQ